MSHVAPPKTSESTRTLVRKPTPSAGQTDTEQLSDVRSQGISQKGLTEIRAAAEDSLAAAISVGVFGLDPRAESENLPATLVAVPAPRIGGRPKSFVFTECLKVEVCALVAGGMTLAQAAGYLGMARSTLTLAMDKEPDFAESVRGARHAAEGQLLLQLAHASKTSWKAAVYLLEHLERRPGKARARRRVKEQDRIERERNAPRPLEDRSKLFDKQGRRIRQPDGTPSTR